MKKGSYKFSNTIDLCIKIRGNLKRSQKFKIIKGENAKGVDEKISYLEELKKILLKKQ